MSTEQVGSAGQEVEMADILARARALVSSAVRLELGALAQRPQQPSAAVIREAVRIAESNKLLGELATALVAWGIEPPIDVMARVAQYRAKSRRSAEMARVSLGRICDAFTSSGVNWVAYKGQVLQSQLGRELAHRPSSDVDVLVAKADFDRAIAALIAAGHTLPMQFATPWWRDWLGEHPLISPDRSGLTIDLHHKVQQPGCPQPRRMEQWLIGPDSVIFGDLPVPTLGRLNAALLGAINVVKAFAHREAGGGHGLDFIRMLTRADDDFRAALSEEAARQGLTRTLELATLAVERWVEVGVGAGTVRTAGSPDWEAVILTPDSPDHARPRGRTLLWALTDGRSAVRVGRFLREGAFVMMADNARRREGHPSTDA